MDLMMSSESFGSSNNNENDGENSLRDGGMILLNEETGRDSGAGGVLQDVLGENVSEDFCRARLEQAACYELLN